MHIGFRYHVVTIIAILFSTTLGILVGGALFQDSGLLKEQGLIINDLEERFKENQIKMQTLQSKLVVAEKREETVFRGWDLIRSLMFKDSLEKRNVVITSLSTEFDTSRLEQLFLEAGAKVMKCVQIDQQSLEDFYESELREFELSGTKNLIFVSWLERPLSIGRKTILEEMKINGWTLVFLQPFSVDFNLNDYLGANLVIDIADTMIGELGLILGLANEHEGIYGIGSAASALLPIDELSEVFSL